MYDSRIASPKCQSGDKIDIFQPKLPRKEGGAMILRRISNWPRWDWRDPFEELERMRRQMDRLYKWIDFLRG
jgi:hypothetical protein